MNNWLNEWSGEFDSSSGPKAPPIQAVEFTPDKKVVWTLRSWEAPNLGPATTIQILDEAGDGTEGPEKVSSGEVR